MPENRLPHRALKDPAFLSSRYCASPGRRNLKLLRASKSVRGDSSRRNPKIVLHDVPEIEIEVRVHVRIDVVVDAVMDILVHMVVGGGIASEEGFVIVERDLVAPL